MKQIKTSLLALAVTSALSLTACSMDSTSGANGSSMITANPAQNIKTIATLQSGFDSKVAMAEYKKIKPNVASNAQGQIGDWIKGYSMAVNSGKTASNGVTGKYPYQKAGKTKYRVLNEQGVEYNQLVKKGLIGAYQLQGALRQAGMIGNQPNQTTLENVTALLLGDYKELAKDARDTKYDGNEFKKYMIKYKGLTNQLYDALAEAQANVDNTPQFKQAIMKAISAGYAGIATRSVYYLEKGASELAQGKGKFASAVHNTSEGLGMVYSLQYSGLMSEAQINSFLTNLNLYNTADAIAQLKQESALIQRTFNVSK